MVKYSKPILWNKVPKKKNPLKLGPYDATQICILLLSFVEAPELAYGTVQDRSKYASTPKSSIHSAMPIQ